MPIKRRHKLTWKNGWKISVEIPEVNDLSWDDNGWWWIQLTLKLQS